MREEGFANFEIWERDAHGGRVRAADRAEYYPIFYPDPVQYTAQILGFDIASEPVRNAALQHARRSGDIAATPPITLITNREPDGFMCFIPVYPKGAASDAGEPEGYLYGVYGTGPVIENILSAKSLPAPLGDVLLKEAAQRLRERAGEGDTVARPGGDEFAILQMVQGDPLKAAETLADGIARSLAKPFDLEGKKVIVGASIGIAVAPRDGLDSARLLKSADLALYAAKAHGRNGCQFFHKDLEANTELRHALHSELREALVRGEFEPYYQPVLDIATSKVCAMEALVHWRHPLRGTVPPDQFIPVAEETGLLVPIGGSMIRRACADAVNWPANIKVAIKLSALQFSKGDVAEAVADALSHSGLDAGRLELEITESILFKNADGNIAQLEALKRLGASLVLDDFAAGRAPLNRLTIFRFDKIKIDKSLIGDLAMRAERAAVARAIISLGRSLGMATVAEGVETEPQLALARAAGCEQAQGALFGPPATAADVASLVALKKDAACQAA